MRLKATAPAPGALAASQDRGAAMGAASDDADGDLSVGASACARRSRPTSCPAPPRSGSKSCPPASATVSSPLRHVQPAPARAPSPPGGWSGRTDARTQRRHGPAPFSGSPGRSGRSPAGSALRVLHPTAAGGAAVADRRGRGAPLGVGRDVEPRPSPDSMSRRRMVNLPHCLGQAGGLIDPTIPKGRGLSGQAPPPPLVG